MYCSNCGRKNEEGANFCEDCGAKLVTKKVEKPSGTKLETKKEEKSSGKKIGKIILIGCLIGCFLLALLYGVIQIINYGGNDVKENKKEEDKKERVLTSEWAEKEDGELIYEIKYEYNKYGEEVKRIAYDAYGNEDEFFLEYAADLQSFLRDYWRMEIEEDQKATGFFKMEEDYIYNYDQWGYLTRCDFLKENDLDIYATFYSYDSISVKEKAKQSEKDNTEVKNVIDRFKENISFEKKETITVGIINIDPNMSGYCTANDADMKKMFTEENGYNASFAYSINNDEQIQCARKFIQDGVDYLLLNAVDVYGWEGVLKEAKEAGILVILFDRTINASSDLYETVIVSDMAREGQTAVDWLKSQNLAEYNIIHLQGIMGSAAQVGRSGALDTEVAANANWNLVKQQTAEWSAEKAQQIVQYVIDGGMPFNVIYAENDDMAKGAVAALDKAGISHGVGKDVIIMGFDCNRWALQELLNKNWNYDGQCSPFQASYIDAVIKKLEAGETVEKIIIIEDKGFDARTITPEDVFNYGI